MQKVEMLIVFLSNHKIVTAVAIAIIFDLFIGILRATKEKRTNSSIGIDGMIRKTAMIGCLCFLGVVDFLMQVNLISWLPKQVLDLLTVISMDAVGITDVFGILFIVFELLSIVKNWTLLGLPIFKGINDWINTFLEKFTDELPTTNKNNRENGHEY